ncbi:MAG TPA: bifunctional phosphoglucose/phosphomannose isomerase [Candidatus Thermoplasmatota archaeon]
MRAAGGRAKPARGVDLDRPQDFTRVDRDDMLGRVERFPADLQGALDACQRQAPGFRKGGRYVSSVLVAGMGGSAIAGMIAGGALRSTLPVPMEVVQDYTLPAHARRETLVFVSSYSGGTEETLSMLEDALERGCRVVGTTSGGALKERLAEEGLPCFDLPAGVQPRAALPHLVAPVLEALERTELAVTRRAAAEAVRVCEALAAECARGRPERSNPAKRAARAMAEGTPFIYGSGVLRAPATRWRTQLNENAKVLAREDFLPDSNHNDINAWPFDPRAKGCCVVLLRDPKGSRRVDQRAGLTRKFAEEGGAAAVVEVRARGEGALARALSATLIGDFASVYLALLRGVDPTPVEVIARLKRELARRT